MTIADQPLPGVLVLQPKVFQDQRGEFVKTFHSGMFFEWNITFQAQEEFFSTSQKNVIRGMHIQLPPYAGQKIVSCIRGRVLDVVLDLRRQAPTFGQAAAVELSEANRRVLFIPRGVAHGFLSLEDLSTMTYLMSAVHAPNHDGGVRWDSFGFVWGVPDPICSERDRALPRLSDFASPF